MCDTLGEHGDFVGNLLEKEQPFLYNIYLTKLNTIPIGTKDRIQETEDRIQETE